jgi:hypothetical protein
MKKTCLAIVSFTALVTALGTQAAGPYREAPITLDAAAFLPEAWRQGDNYRVAAEVSNDGVFNRYTLQTDYGEETVESTVELAVRLQELRALAVMEAMSQTEVMGDALVAATKAPFKGAAALVTSPLSTSVSIARGTGRFFGNLGHSLFSSDPDQDNALKVILGYDVAKRNFAYELGIDPYTSYEPVVRRLGEIARAAVVGGVAPGAALAAVNFRGSTLVQFSATADGMRQLVRDNPPGTLRKINRDKLAAMGVGDDLADAFLDNYRFNPLEETLLIGALEAMPKVEGRALMIANASLAGSESSARLNRVIAQMMAAYYDSVDDNVAIVDAGGAVGLRRADGTLVLMAPVDYLVWTEGVAANLSVLDQELAAGAAFSGKELWIGGGIDPAAREQFEAAGWRVRDGARDFLAHGDDS